MKFTIEYFEGSVGFCETYYGMFMGRTKDREREGSWWIGGNTCGKMERKGGKREWLSINLWLTRMSV